MSAIFGIVSLDGQGVEAQTMRGFGGSLAYRGEGEPHQWVSAAAGLGCCHFPATPEAVGETVPYVHAASGVVVASDARLDERETLMAALGLSPEPGTVLPDNVLLAEAYLKWGADCPAHLQGDFAFAVWDARQGRLFAARDHFGVKPLYYVADKGRFAFATEPRALLELPGVSREIDLTNVAVSLANLHDNSDGTPYRAVRRLCEAEAVVVTRAGAQIHRYYRPDPLRRISLRSDAEYAEAFREIFFRAVRRRLRSSGPVGAMLSGGLDSSAITCVAASIAGAQAGPRVEAFSLVYPDRPECDESCYIQAAVRRSGVPWHPVPVHDRRSLEDVQRLVESLQEPDVPLGAFANGSVCPEAAACGMRVLLDGHGGDETVSLGFEHLRELFDDRKILAFSREYLLLARIDEGLDGWRGLLRVLTNLGLVGRLKRRVRSTAAAWRKKGTPAPESAAAWPFIDAQLVKEADLAGRNAAMKAAQAEARTQRRWHHYIITQTGQSRGFERLSRQAGTGTSELRYPFWDKDLVEFCLALPSRQKLRGGFTRAVMRDALQDVLPPEITRRRAKVDFLPQATACLKNLKKSACMSLVSVHNAPRSPILDLSWLEAALENFHNDQITSGLEQQALWRCLAIASWLKTLEGSREHPPESFAENRHFVPERR